MKICKICENLGEKDFDFVCFRQKNLTSLFVSGKRKEYCRVRTYVAIHFDTAVSLPGKR